MSEQVKQEGEFKLKKSKVPTVKAPGVSTVTKVDLSKPKEEEDAIQEQSTNESMLQPEQSKVGLQEVEQGNAEQKIVANQVEENQEIITINLTGDAVGVAEKTETLEAQAEAAVNEYQETGKKLPENVEKLVSFMEETGGSVEDYVRLNTNYDNVSPDALLKEYYKKTKPHLDSEEIEFYMDETFAYDEEEDEEREIKKKRIAFKEEVGKAKVFLEDLKSKYYDEIKSRTAVNPEQQKAMDFFNRYNQDQQTVEQKHSMFKDNTKRFFTQEFKGFDFNAGGKSFKVNPQNTETVAEKQSNITNLLKKFLNDDGDVTDLNGYHKAMFAAENADTIANHFYEQGKTDAIKDMLAKSNNISTDPRPTASGEIMVNGFKVRAINGVDSTKLKIKKSFN
jgi:hypothetical protein